MITLNECPEMMRQQKNDNKKDKYIEITECLLKEDVLSMAVSELVEYADILKSVISDMDPMIYEHYRALSDQYLEVIRKMYESDCDASEKLSEFIAFGAEKHFLLEEWFEKKESKTEDDSMCPAGEVTDEPELLLITPRSVCFRIKAEGHYNSAQNFDLYLNGKKTSVTDKIVNSIYGLLPSHEYTLTAVSADGTKYQKVSFTTAYESVTLNVRDFGAIGDGVSDDTHPIQTAIMNCPKDGRVLIPEGCYRVKTIFFKSNMNLEFAKNAVVMAIPGRKGLGYVPGVLPSTDGRDEFHMGSWEGNPETMFSGILSGIEAENVNIYGEGILDGAASKENWWKNPKEFNIAYRPRLFFIRNCKNIRLQGITLKNSPAWTMHPFFSDNLGFYNLNVVNPSDSPNTDGLDPESCSNVEIAGVCFSLGDDCIAVKAGKIYMGRKYHKPSEHIIIRNCLMRDGHGAVTLGSEMAGGVIDLRVEDCSFINTDRGLRVKTRRGRGRDAIIDNICFSNIDMNNVMTPFVVNSFYFCDPDGKTSYVQSRDCFPVDERTPAIKRLIFENIDAQNSHVAAAYVEGLPEQKIEELIMKNIKLTFAEDAKCSVPAMSDGVEACSKVGIVAKNIKKVVLENVDISGNVGDDVILSELDEFERK